MVVLNVFTLFLQNKNLYFKNLQLFYAEVFVNIKETQSKT